MSEKRQANLQTGRIAPLPPLKIAFNSVGSSATGAHRMLEPMDLLRNKFGADFEPLQGHRLTEQIKACDLVWLQCVIGSEQRDLVEKCKQYNTPVIIDYDDSFADLPAIVRQRTELSSSQIRLNWDYYLNHASVITVSCEALKNRVQEFSDKPVFVLPNCLRSDLYHSQENYTPFEGEDTLRVLYTCSSSHLQDLKEMLWVLSKLIKWNPKVELITQGRLDFSYYRGTFKGRHRHIPEVAYASYYSLLRDIRPHVLLAPLRTNTYNSCRSNLKYLQAGLMKCAFVGSNLAPYQDVVHGKTGLLVDYSWGWLWQSRKLAKDFRFAQELGENAYYDAGNYLLEHHIGSWVEAFRCALRC